MNSLREISRDSRVCTFAARPIPPELGKLTALTFLGLEKQRAER